MLNSFGPSLPAAVIIKTPASAARVIAASMSEFVLFTPRLMFTTSAPSFTALSIASIILSSDTPRPSSDILYDIIFTLGDIPCKLPLAMIMPRTCVPCPSVSSEEFFPVCAKSGCVKSTPVSMIATVIPVPSYPFLIG